MDTTPNPGLNPSANARGAARSRAAAGKYMTFRLDGQAYGVEILRVKELIRLQEITRVPQANAVIRGVINLRGKIIPVVDLRQKFGMGCLVPTEQTVIIVMQLPVFDHDLEMGVLVDEVLEVRHLSDGQIEPPPDLGPQEAAPAALCGIGKDDKQVILLLDIAKLMSGGDTADLKRAAILVAPTSQEGVGHGA
ncbi:MAG: purine-binding chemotaxis protein CheW [Deltaproteobacteria bacterium]|nr:purine-binding chemotaxis protein CheW [Deltaproteobacteria bacterium]